MTYNASYYLIWVVTKLVLTVDAWGGGGVEGCSKLPLPQSFIISVSLMYRYKISYHNTIGLFIFVWLLDI